VNGFECVRESIDIFERSLGTNAAIRTVGELARRAGYSAHYFTRLFSIIVGVPPKEYISGRILSESARKIAGSSASLASVAIDTGYPDYETFSRAFKRRFGVSPNAVRARGAIPQGFLERAYPLRPDPSHSTDARALTLIDPETVSLAPFRIVGLPFFIDAGTVSFHKQWATFMGVQSRIVGRTSPETYFQFSSWTDDDFSSGLSILCGLEAEKISMQEPFFTARDIPPATYLKFRHVGDVSTIHLTYEFIYRGWLSAHDTRPADFWEFQKYSDGGASTEIFIPVDVCADLD
jgi:AraC family transcriptional regulator